MDFLCSFLLTLSTMPCELFGFLLPNSLFELGGSQPSPKVFRFLGLGLVAVSTTSPRVRLLADLKPDSPGFPRAKRRKKKNVQV